MGVSEKLTLQRLQEILEYVCMLEQETEDIQVTEIIEEIKRQVMYEERRVKNGETNYNK